MKNPRIMSALIGLCGAINNNGKTENTDSVILQALRSGDCDEMVERIHREKYAISPGCADCPHPCGNTSDYDMDRYYDATPEELAGKEAALEELLRLSERLSEGAALPKAVCRAISYLGYGLEAASYRELTEELRSV